MSLCSKVMETGLIWSFYKVNPIPTSDILEKNVCDDKSDYSTLKLEKSMDASQTESGSNIIGE